MGKPKEERRERPRTEHYPVQWIRLSMSASDDKHRYIWCRHRDRCLEFAALERWDGMTCMYCPTNPHGKKPEKEIDYYEGND